MADTWKAALWQALPLPPFQREALPEGVYAVWILQGARLEMQVWHLSLEGEEMSLRGWRQFKHPLRKGVGGRRSRVLGGFQQTSRGVTLLANLGAGQSLGVVYFDYALGGVPGLWRGRGQDSHGDLRVAMTALPPGLAPLRQALRDLGEVLPEHLPKVVKPWLLA